MNVSEFSNSPVIPPSAKRKQRKKRKKGKSPAVPDHSSSPESSDDELSCVAKEKNESALLNQAFNNGKLSALSFSWGTNRMHSRHRS